MAAGTIATPLYFSRSLVGRIEIRPTWDELPVLDGPLRHADRIVEGFAILPDGPALQSLKLAQYVHEVGSAGDADHALLNFPAWPKHLAIPVRHLAEKETAETFATVGDQQMKVARHEGQPWRVGCG